MKRILTHKQPAQHLRPERGVTFSNDEIYLLSSDEQKHEHTGTVLPDSPTYPNINTLTSASWTSPTCSDTTFCVSVI